MGEWTNLFTNSLYSVCMRIVVSNNNWYPLQYILYIVFYNKIDQT